MKISSYGNSVIPYTTTVQYLIINISIQGRLIFDSMQFIISSSLFTIGEFMQLGSKEDETERFNHYLQKTFKKTASLIAHSCKAVSLKSSNQQNAIGGKKYRILSKTTLNTRDI